jgi:chromosomal replication initiator protein
LKSDGATVVFSIPLPATRPLAAAAAHGERGQISEFIAGPENRLARVAADNLLLPVDNKQAFNPLVICGPRGSGKSHLARGLASAWKQQYSGQTVHITSPRDSEFPPSVEQLQPPGLLLIEDLHDIKDSSLALRKLLLLIDQWLDVGGKLLVTSTVPPATLPHLPAILRSRLSAGLVVDLVNPKLETRLAILQAYARSHELSFNEGAAQRLARNAGGSVGQLIDAIKHFSFGRCSANRSNVIDDEAVRQYLQSAGSAAGQSIGKILSLVARHYGLKTDDLKGRSRRQAVVTARWVAMYLAWRHSNQTLLRIGRYLGGRDHTTVLHGCRKIEKQLKSELGLQQAITQLEDTITSRLENTNCRPNKEHRKSC